MFTRQNSQVPRKIPICQSTKSKKKKNVLTHYAVAVKWPYYFKNLAQDTDYTE
jgi:hypothetical protein